MVAHYGTVAAAARRRRGGRRAAAALAALGCLAAAAWVASVGDGAVRPGGPSAALVRWLGTSDTASTRTATLSAADFLAFAAVREALAARGVDVDDDAAVADFVPRRVSVSWRPDLVDGGLGGGAGHVVFCLSRYAPWSATAPLGVVAGWLVVMTAAGVLESVAAVGAPGAAATEVFNGLKVRDPDTLLLAGNGNRTGLGRAHLFRWRDGSFEVCDGVETNSHDIDVSAVDPSKFWYIANWTKAAGPSPADFRIYLREADFEDARSTFASPPVGAAGIAINHAQLLDGDTRAVAGVDVTAGAGMLFALDVATGERIWTFGGPDGDLAIFDVDGTPRDPTDVLWDDAHNGEYLGAGEYGVFANRRPDAPTSAMVVVAVDEAARTARVVWEYEVPYSPIYGDADRLPSGNLLGCFWPETLDDAVAYEWAAVEVTRDTAEVAWRLEVYGKPLAEAGVDFACATDDAGATTCSRSLEATGVEPAGWAAYNVERFYDAPRVGSVACAGGVLTFDAYSSFRENAPRPGVLTVAGADVSVAFDFAPHWRPSRVVAAVDARTGDLVVTDRFGRATTASFACD